MVPNWPLSYSWNHSGELSYTQMALSLLLGRNLGILRHSLRIPLKYKGYSNVSMALFLFAYFIFILA